MNKIEVPGSNGTLVAGINNLGQIVGMFVGSDGNAHGFQRTGRVYTTLDYPGATRTWAIGINDFGVVVGFYSGPGCASTYNVGCGFVATPVH
jgi:probable HAF family extracellular repeat protein